MRRRAARLGALVLCLAWTAGALGCPVEAEQPGAGAPSIPTDGLWVARGHLLSLPRSGPAWEALAERAREPAGAPDLSDQDDPTNVRVLAKALYAARTGDAGMAREVEEACERVQGTESGADALAVSRELMSYVLAADLVGLDGGARERFAQWLRALRPRSFQGRTLRSTHEDRPNNWGTHAGASRIAVAAYLGDVGEIERAARVFRGWTGEPDGWQQFDFGALWWQADPQRPRAVNPVGALRAGHPIGGVLPDDQRRGGPFTWPPPRENYVYEALQGAVAQAVLLERLGYDAWSWGDRAVLRAFRWLHEHADYPAQGDDTWQPHVVNRAYQMDFPAPVPSRPGKAVGYADWTHAPARSVSAASGRLAAPELLARPDS